jgi:YHS domain-containing protein
MKKFVFCMSLAAVMAFPMVLVAAPDGDPINKLCPLTGKDVNPTKTVTYEKQLIGFCCDDCKGKFETDPKKYIGKVKEFKKKTSSVEIAFTPDGDPINKLCPLTGKDVNPTKTVTYEKQLIGFCCDDCKGKFETDPKKYIGKVKEFKKKTSSVEISFDDPINKKCPLTGKDIVAGKTVEYEKQLIGFCCGDCVSKFEGDPKKYIGKVKEFKKKTSSVEISFDDPINKKCPLTGKDIVAGRTVEYEKQLIGFCCADCVSKFEGDPKKYIGKVKEFKKKTSSVEISFTPDGDPINKLCPLTGKDVNPTKTVTYEKQLIGFCCDDCKGKFETDPKKYIGKVKEFKKKSSSVD